MISNDTRHEFECEKCGKEQVWWATWQPAESDTGIQEGYICSMDFEESECKCYSEQTPLKVMSKLEDEMSERLYESAHDEFVPEFDDNDIEFYPDPNYGANK